MTRFILALVSIYLSRICAETGTVFEDGLVADCSNAHLFSDKCEACKGAPFDAALNSVVTCKAKSGNGQIKKGVCFPKKEHDVLHYVCKPACVYEKEDVCSNMVPDTKKPPEFLGIGDSCCKGDRPICCGRPNGKNFKDAVCKQGQSLQDAMLSTGTEDPSEIQACCHVGGRDPWPEEAREHIIFKNAFYECERDKYGKLKKISFSKGRSVEEEISDPENLPAKEQSSTNIYSLVPLNFVFILAALGCFVAVRVNFCAFKFGGGYEPLEASEEI